MSGSGLQELEHGLKKIMDTKHLQVLRQYFMHMRQGEISQSTIVKETLRKIAGRSSGDQSVHLQQEEGIVKSIIELTNALEPMLNNDESSASKEIVKVALMSTLEQGIRMQNTIGYNSLTSSIATSRTHQLSEEKDVMNLSTSSSVTHSAMVSTNSFIGNSAWNHSTRINRTSKPSSASLSPSKTTMSSRAASIMFSQAEQILKEHNSKLSNQIESLDTQVAHVTAQRNKLRSSVRAAQQQAAREVESARIAMAAALKEKEEAKAVADTLKLKTEELSCELSVLEDTIARDRSKYTTILKNREGAKRSMKEQAKRADAAEQEIQALSPKKERAEAVARSAQAELKQSMDEYARIKAQLEESRRKEAAKDLEIKRLENATSQLSEQLSKASTDYQGQKRRSDEIKQEILSDMKNTSGAISSMEQRLEALVVENEKLSNQLRAQEEKNLREKKQTASDAILASQQAKSISSTELIVGKQQQQVKTAELGVTGPAASPVSAATSNPNGKSASSQPNPHPSVDVAQQTLQLSNVQKNSRSVPLPASSNSTAELVRTYVPSSSSVHSTILYPAAHQTSVFYSGSQSAAGRAMKSSSGSVSTAQISLAVHSEPQQKRPLVNSYHRDEPSVNTARSAAPSLKSGAIEARSEAVVPKPSVTVSNPHREGDNASTASGRNITKEISKGRVSHGIAPSGLETVKERRMSKDSQIHASTTFPVPVPLSPESRLQLAEARAQALTKLIESMPASLNIAQAERRVLEARLEKTVGACETRVGAIASAAEMEIARLQTEIGRECQENQVLFNQLEQYGATIQSLSSQIRTLQKQKQQQNHSRHATQKIGYDALRTSQSIDDGLNLPLPPWDPVMPPRSRPGTTPNIPISPLKKWDQGSSGESHNDLPADQSQLSLQRSFEAYLSNNYAKNDDVYHVNACGAMSQRQGLHFPQTAIPDYMLTRGQVLANEISQHNNSYSSNVANSSNGGKIDIHTSSVLLHNLQQMMALHNLGPLS